MIAFGSVDHEARRVPPLRGAGHPPGRRADSEIYPMTVDRARSSAPTTRCWTDFADRDGLEALVLVHQDAEIVEPDFCEIVRESAAGPRRRA